MGEFQAEVKLLCNGGAGQSAARDAIVLAITVGDALLETCLTTMSLRPIHPPIHPPTCPPIHPATHPDLTNK